MGATLGLVRYFPDARQEAEHVASQSSWGAVETATHTYLKGTMVVDLFDAKTKKLVWRGIATEAVSYSPVKNAERIDKSIETMFGDQFLDND